MTLGGTGGPTADPQALTLIAAACRDRERVRFGYRARDDTASRREVEPHSLVNVGRRWYLVAWDCGRSDWRTFRVDRLTRPATGARFQPRELPAKDAAAYVAQSLSARPNRYEARLTLHASAEAMRKRMRGYSAGGISRSARTAASTAPATTTSTGSAPASPCSASTSTSTSRPSSSSTCRVSRAAWRAPARPRMRGMGKRWVLDTETKGTGAQMVPLEQVLEQPKAPAKPLLSPRTRRPPRAR